MVRVQPPFLPSSAKRLVKSPKIYLRDTGILHALLDIETWDDLLGHPVFGHSWESMVIENVLAQMPGWRGSFYRTAKGAEIDLVLEKGNRRIAIECKASSAPEPTQGFWNALEDIGTREAWIVAPIEGSYPLARGVAVASLSACMKSLRESSG
jgi:predicted AAA+ superfamily ATPase